MHLESLRIFRDLVETGTFSKAAELNYLTQSAVSQQLKTLEKSVGQPLLDRTSRQLKLTAAGRMFFRTAKHMVTDYEDMTARIRSLAPESSQKLRIAAIYSVGPYILQRYLPDFIKNHPEVKVEVDYQKANRICDDILRGRSDLSIMAYPVKRRDLEVIPLADEEMVLILPRRHPLARQARLDIADLAGRDFIAFDRGTPTRKALDRVLRQAGVRPKFRLELDNIETIKSAVSNGMGVSIVPRPTVANEQHLHLRRFSGLRLFRPLGVLIRRRRKDDGAVRSFLEHLGKTARHESPAKDSVHSERGASGETPGSSAGALSR